MGLDYEAICQRLIHPTQIEVLRLLDGATRSPNQLADRLDQPLGRVSYHVRELAKRDLIVLVDTVPRRGALEHFYTSSESVRKQRVRRAA